MSRTDHTLRCTEWWGEWARMFFLASMGVCKAHDVYFCEACVVDYYHAWLDDLAVRRERIKQERRELTVYDKYDLGGEA